MPFWRSRSDEAVDDFDDFDPTPYSGGYDQSLTYGRPLPPSDEICYSVSAAGDIDFERPNYSSGSHISAYEAPDADSGDQYGRPRPKPQSQPYSGYGGDSAAGEGYDWRPQSQEYGSGFGGMPTPQEYGSVFGVRPQLQEYGSDYGSGDGGQQQPQKYGSGYRRSEEGCGEEGYGKRSYGGGEYRRNEEEGYGRQAYGGGEYRRSEEGYGGGGDVYRRNEESEHEGRANYERPSYGGGDEEGSGRYRKSGYGDEESGRYKKSGYGDEEKDGYSKPSQYGGEDGEEYGRSKYAACNPEGDYKYGIDSDEENKHSYQKHHHRRNYDED